MRTYTSHLKLLPDAARFRAWFSWMSRSTSPLSAVPPRRRELLNVFSKLLLIASESQAEQCV